MLERREYVRLDTRLPVEYRVVGPAAAPPRSTAKRPAVTKDISGGGVRLILTEPLTPAALLEVSVHLPERPVPLVFTGEVVWVESYAVIGGSGREQRYEAGIKFVQIAPADRQAILQHVILSFVPKGSSVPLRHDYRIGPSGRSTISWMHKVGSCYHLQRPSVQAQCECSYRGKRQVRSARKPMSLHR
ncbi:MAG: PilZ domain-containing protein [Candidatus Omnitrophica bacterium]|nr:PilZ domain-containing protein [Candidatus Omnitrophota bacterium]